MSENINPIFVVGHKNPDTDSICSAIAYANLKNQISDKEYVPCRAGDISNETKFVLQRFHMPDPMLIKDVRTQIRDMDYRRIDGLSEDVSLKDAWKLMRDENVVTLPVTKGTHLEGVIAMADIVKSYMDVLDSRILTDAHTCYRNIVETLDGKMVVGDINEFAEKGKVLIAAGTPEVVENYIEEGDIILLGNRYDVQLCAIEMNASCLIVCGGSDVTKSIQKQAIANNCKIITSPHDTYTAARLINQSMPISHFMRGTDLVLFHLNDYIDDVQLVMSKERHRYFPVLDEKNQYAGIISRRNFLGAHKKQLVLVDHNEMSQAVNGADSAEILEIIDHHRLGTIQTTGPVFFRNQPLGCTCTIIYQMYRENGIKIEPKIAGILCSAIISDTLLFRSPTCTEVDKEAAKMLAEIAGIRLEPYAKEMFKAGSDLSSKSPEEIIHQDYKRFTIHDRAVCIGQISGMSTEDLEKTGESIREELQKTLKEDKIDDIFFLLTNILDESSGVMGVGLEAEEALRRAFKVEPQENGIFLLRGVVSRKKQFLPAIDDAFQRIDSES
ncbi:MAG: putative manganese-dependent inorganic diphosphatase [Lachnospiraceae bacterium]|nr:putative manganese-dependent inorganic diphosphatase [Lachnospiraceae bacterium]